MADSVAFKDFSKTRKRVYFTIAPDDFDAYETVPVEVMQELVTLGGKFSGIDQNDPAQVAGAIDAIKAAVDGLLLPESAATFKARMSKGSANPIDLGQFMQVFHWLSEVHSGRPLESPATSSNSSPAATSGTGSTAKPKRRASTRSTSLSKTS